ncbi:MAG: hypothetical protein ACJAXM_000864 [Arenicella sp.]|jgi:hypothetical protein
MGRYTLNIMVNKYGFIIFCLLFVGCQSKIEKIGQQHAEEVLKWQELARYAGNELKYLGLTVTAGVQINQSAEGTTYSIVNVQLNRDANHTEVDLLSPEFAEKFACGKDCQKLGLYDSNFTKPETQLSSFFFEEEGRFFEFYGRLTRLNDTLADYRASSPDILKKYLTLMFNRKLSFNSLSEFIDNLEKHVTENKLLAFSKSGFISPVEDRLSSMFIDDLTANLPTEWEINVDDVKMPDDDWNSNASTPDELFYTGLTPDELFYTGLTPDELFYTGLTPDELFYANLISKTASLSVITSNWEQAKQNALQVGSIVCSFSDNSFGVVKKLEANDVTLDVIAQARVLVDGMKLYLQPGYLFTSAESFYFVKGSPNQTYTLSDIATCNVEHLKRGQKIM